MGVFDDMKSLLNQYASGNPPPGDTGAHFQQVAHSVDSGTLAAGIAAAMRSDQTPPFAQLVSQLFAASTGDQKVAMLNTLLSSLTPEQRAQITGLLPGIGTAAAVTPAQASAVSPGTVASIVERAEQHDSGIVDKMSAFYAAHPTLMRTLGTAAMMIAMRKIAERHG